MNLYSTVVVPIILDRPLAPSDLKVELDEEPHVLVIDFIHSLEIGNGPECDDGDFRSGF